MAAEGSRRFGHGEFLREPLLRELGLAQLPVDCRRIPHSCDAQGDVRRHYPQNLNSFGTGQPVRMLLYLECHASRCNHRTHS